MEIEIPFSKRIISLAKNAKELKYRAILSRDSLFYGLFDSDDNLLNKGKVDVDSIPKNSILRESSHEFHQSLVAFNNPIFSLSNGQNLIGDEILQFTHSINEISRYHISTEKNIIGDTHLTFAIPKTIIKALSKHLVNCKFTHYQNVLLTSIAPKMASNEIYLSLISGNLNLCFYKNGKLQIANCYQVRNESDFYYYIALIFDQFKLIKGETKIMMDGDFSEVKFDEGQFYRFFGVEPQFIYSDHETSETNTALVALTRLNKCASLEEV